MIGFPGRSGRLSAGGYQSPRTGLAPFQGACGAHLGQAGLLECPSVQPGTAAIVRPSCRLKIGTCFRNSGPWGLESNAGSTMEGQVLCPGGSRPKVPLVSLHLSISIINWDWPCWEPITPVTRVSPRTCSWSTGGWPRGWCEPMVINSPETQDVCLLTLSGEIR